MRLLFHTDYFIQLIRDKKLPETSIRELCRQGKIQGWILSTSLPSMHGQISQTTEAPAANQKIQELLEGFSILPHTGDDILRSLSAEGKEFEVTLAAHLVTACGLDGVVTCDPDAFKETGIATLTPDTLLEQIKHPDNRTDRVSLLDIPASYHEILPAVEAEIAQVVRSGHFILGPKVAELETKIAEFCQTSYAVGVSSGTDALQISLMAAEIGPGDEVITTPYTFFATAGCITRVGATPVFVDIDETTYNIDPAQIEDRISSRTRAIIPVHLYGQCADMEPILEIARRHKLRVIEDAAQAIGAEYQGRQAGSMGDFGCFSFFPAKNLGGFGDGGIVTTSSKEFHEKLVSLRVHGSGPKYYHKVVGGNFRLDALQAAVVIAKLDFLKRWTEKRREHAHFYNRLFETRGLLKHIKTPKEVFTGHVYNQYVIRAGSRRDELKQFLLDRKIHTEIYYPLTMHIQECFKFLGHSQGDFPVSEKAALESLALPVPHEITPEQQERVADAIAEFFS